MLSPTKRRIFRLLLLILPVFFFVFLEAGLRLFRYGGDTRLFVPIPDRNSPYYGINPQIGRRYFRHTAFLPTPRKDLFLREKPASSFRIFVLGGSTAAGFPYGNNVTFPRILHRRLADTFPDRRIEVVNMAMTAINSYTLRDFLPEILDQKPDALLIYAGHNEYYGALGVASIESLGRHRSLILLSLRLRRWKTFLLLQDAIIAIRSKIHPGTSDPMADGMETEMARIVKDKEIPYGTTLFRAGEVQFRKNLEDILEAAKKARVPVFISELVSNIRGQAPFVSLPFDTLPPAEHVFRHARALERNGDWEGAKRRYLRAKDLDALRFRAPESFNTIIREVASRYGAGLIPMRRVFEEASPQGLPGNTLFCDHLHPTIDGYFLMADAFYEAMRQAGWIERDWDRRPEKPRFHYRTHWGWTRLDSVYAALTIRHLKAGWPFQKHGPNRFLQVYQPRDFLEALVLEGLKRPGWTLEQAHLWLAKHFESRGDWWAAYQEYRALTYIVPTLDLFYEPALEILLTHDAYEEAYRLFDEGIRFNTSGFMLKWAGQLALAVGETEKGITYLEEAWQRLPDEPVVLYNLALGCYHAGKVMRGDEVAARLARLPGGRGYAEELGQKREEIVGGR